MTSQTYPISHPSPPPLDDERSFRRILVVSLGIYLFMAILIGVLPTPEKHREEITQLPPRIAKLILEAPKEEPKPETAPSAKKKEEETPEKKIQKEKEKNQKVAKQSGLLKLLSKDAKQGGGLKDLLQGADLGEVLTDASPLLQAPSADTSLPKMEVPVISTGGGVGSGTAVARETTVSSEIRLGEKKTSTVVAPARRNQPTQDANKPGERSSGSISAIVASYRGGIDFLYKKSLRENPLLRGVVTVEFTIAPSGEVQRCHIVSSTMQDTAFEDLLTKRILQWKFPPIPGGQNTTVTYPLEFSPV